ncbi:MAG: protein kinase [Planctomycetota bacterium]
MVVEKQYPVAPKGELLLGRIALECKYISREQLKEALRIQESENPVRPIGRILLSLGYLDEKKLDSVLEIQSKRLEARLARPFEEAPQEDVLFGHLAIKNGMTTLEQVENALREQAKDAVAENDYLLGQVMVMQKIITVDQVRFLLAKQDKKIFICSACQTKITVTGHRPGEKILCESCGRTLKEPEFLSSTDSQIFMKLSPENRITTLGEYEIIDEISRGGMSVVYKAHKKGSKNIVALKMLMDEKFSTEEDKERFRYEAKILSRLSHPNITAIHDISSADGKYFFAMEFVEGKTLEELLQNKSFSTEESLKIIATVCRALHYAHKHNVFHRDIKPGNILIDKKSGRVVLTDFGLSIIREQRIRLTKTGFAVGTPEYMAPEQCMAQASTRAFDARTDVYSVGIVLYEMLTGRTPFSSDSPIDLITQKLNDPIPPPRRINSNTPIEVEEICLKSLRFKKEERYQSTLEMAKSIEKYIKKTYTSSKGLLKTLISFFSPRR